MMTDTNLVGGDGEDSAMGTMSLAKDGLVAVIAGCWEAAGIQLPKAGRFRGPKPMGSSSSLAVRRAPSIWAISSSV